MKTKILNLGKILFFLIPTVIFANVSAKVDKSVVYKGDSVTFSISASGDKIKFPDIKDINGTPILQSFDSQSIVFINNNVSKTITRSYKFNADKNLTIPSYEVVVDNKSYKTKPINITVLKASNDKKAKLILQASKTNAYVGEPIRLDIILSVAPNAKYDKYQIEPPKFNNFWVKTLNSQDLGAKKVFSYLIFPQIDGNLTIGPIVAHLGKFVKSNDPFFGNDPFFQVFNSEIKWSKISSNKLNFNIKPLPNNLEVYGKYTISAKVDKTKVNANKPVNLTIKIKGIGNIDDIKKFDLDIDDAIVYSDEPKIKTYIKNKNYGGEFTQKIAIVADKNFTIPKIVFKYFDKDLKKEVTLKTKPINITVLGGKNKKDNAKIISANQSSTNVTNNKSECNNNSNCNISLKILYMLIGVILGVFGYYLALKLKELKKEKKEIPLIKKIKKAKNNKELFNLLLPFAKKSEKLDEILKKLEENIYKNGTYKIDKNDIIEELEEILTGDKNV